MKTKSNPQVYDIQVVKIMMVRDKTIPYYAYKISQSEDVANLGFELFKGADREYLAAIVLSVDHTINAVNIIAQGCLDSACFHPREVLKPVILANASCFCLLHNHTSLNVLPSSKDYAVTRKLIKAANLLQIEILDHVVVAENKFYSMRDHDSRMFDQNFD